MKKYLFYAVALAAFASCVSESYDGTEDERRIAKGEMPISFAFNVPTATRADNTGATAAAALGNQFIVWGEKSERATGAAAVTDGSNVHQLVFKNYVVDYVASTAYTTTSNTKDWEYVGLKLNDNAATIPTTSYTTNITPNSGTDAQTIKYWDYSATNYVFTAVSAKNSDLTSGKVTVTKITEKTTDNMVYDKGYTVVLAADADPTKLYFSDRQVIAQGTGADRTATNAYGGNVTLRFRNGVSQVRAAMFETISGYSVTIDNFYYVNDAAPTFATMTTANTTNFAANVPNLTTDKAATLNVTYYASGARQNQPKISVTGTVNNYLTLGTNLFGSSLGTDAAHATYDQSTGDFTPVFPQESNNKSLKLKIDYTLTAPVTGETIHVYGATAEVPADYLQWKANYKYTYIFKISDNTDGKTKLPDGVNPDSPEGLYPITFDAVQVVAEDGQAEYITTVSEPTITTFGVKNSAYSVGKNEYEAGTDIYAIFMEGSAVVTPTASNYKVYSVTSSNETIYPITEASVAESVANSTNNQITCTAYTTNVSIVTKVPGEDGIDIDPMNAVKMGSVAAGVYAIEYTASSAWTGTYDKVYKVIRVTAAP